MEDYTRVRLDNGRDVFIYRDGKIKWQSGGGVMVCTNFKSLDKVMREKIREIDKSAPPVEAI
jgi:NADPH-dependent curcumin reductase CurA